MKLFRSIMRGNPLFKNIMIYLFYFFKSKGKLKDKEHLKVSGPFVEISCVF